MISPLVAFSRAISQCNKTTSKQNNPQAGGKSARSKSAGKKRAKTCVKRAYEQASGENFRARRVPLASPAQQRRARAGGCHRQTSARDAYRAHPDYDRACRASRTFAQHALAHRERHGSAFARDATSVGNGAFDTDLALLPTLRAYMAGLACEGGQGAFGRTKRHESRTRLQPARTPRHQP